MILSTHIVDDVRELCTQMTIWILVKLLGKPQDGINELDGKVFEKHIKKIELEK